MKTQIIVGIFILSLFSCSESQKSEEKKELLSGNPSNNANHEPWSAAQLIEPATLAEIINDSTQAQPVIFSVGPGADVKGSIHMGPAQENENLEKLKSALDTLDKKTEIIIYCGCCPFEHCPNIRPSFQLLNDLKFTHHKLLNIPQNIKVDWLDKGYPKQ